MKAKLLVCLMLAGVFSPSWCHPVPFSYLDLSVGRDGITGSLVIHTIDLAHDLGIGSTQRLLERREAELLKDRMLELIRSRLVLTANGETLLAVLEDFEVLKDRQALRFQVRFVPAKAPGLVGIRCALFPYDPRHQTFVNVYEEGKLKHQEILGQGHTAFEYFSRSGRGTEAVLEKFIRAGIRHILIGPDHILFVIGLLLLGGGLLRLLTIVTAFTLAHSITLSLAALNVWNAPSRVIEPAIALSVVIVGIDNLMAGRAGRDVRAGIAFFFGFIHGFGFANVLRELGLPSQALGWSLFSFNFGVEIGQALIVLAVASSLQVMRSRNTLLAERISWAGSVLVSVAGAYWFMQRVFFPA